MKPISLLKSGLWISYATLITRGFAFLSSLVLARLLEPSEFGIIGIAYVFWSFFTLFTQGTAGSFIIYKGIDNPKYVNTAYTVSLIIGIAFGLGMVAAAPLIASFFNEPALTWILSAFSLNIVLSSAGYVYSGVMTRQLKYQALANITLAQSIIRLLCTTGAALLGLSYWSFVIGDTIGLSVFCVLTWYYSKYQFRLQLHPEVKSEVLSFCINSVGSSIGLYTNFNIDNFTVGKLLGSTSLGFYNLAYQLTMTLSTVFDALLNQLGTPLFAQIPDQERQKKALENVAERIALFAAPTCALIFLVATPQVITVVFGEKWIPIYTVIPGLLFFAYFRIFNSSLNSMLAAKGRPDLNAKVNLRIAPFAVLSFVVGAHQGGIVGVSLAAALVLGLCWTVYWWWFACRNLNWALKEFMFSCFVPILLTIPGILISFKLPLVLSLLAFIIIYSFSIFTFAHKYFSIYQKVTIQAVMKLKIHLNQ
jgi:lipopolysaccharide exporter